MQLLIGVFLCALFLVNPTVAFLGRLSGQPLSKQRKVFRTYVSLSNVQQTERPFQEIGLVGFISSEKNIAEDSMFNNIYDQKAASSIRCITDNVSFAKKRLTSPNNVYKGLINDINFVESPLIEIKAVEEAAKGVDCIVFHNLNMSVLPDCFAMAHRLGVKRAIFDVDITGYEMMNPVSTAYVEALTEALPLFNVAYTVFKHSRLLSGKETMQPFTVLPGEAVLKTAGDFTKRLVSGDLFRVMAESITLPVSYNRVYGMCSTVDEVDTHIFQWMRMQRLSVRDQVNVLLGGQPDIPDEGIIEGEDDEDENSLRFHSHYLPSNTHTFDGDRTR